MVVEPDCPKRRSVIRIFSVRRTMKRTKKELEIALGFQHFLNAFFGGLLSWPMLQPLDPASHLSPMSSVPVIASILSINAFVFLF